MDNPLRIEMPAMINPHTHLREGDAIKLLISLALNGGVDTLGPMPNTEKGLCTKSAVTAYINLAKSFVPPGKNVTFIPYLMLSENTPETTIRRCVNAGIRDAKVYPYGRTHASKLGVQKYNRIIRLVNAAALCGMRIHLHPEHPWLLVPNRDAEYLFLPIARMFLQETDATIFWEHGSDARCIPFWKEMAETDRFYVTLTAHHLATHEDAVYGDVGATCKPPIRPLYDRENLVDLVAKGYPWVMAGADDAPHDVTAKHRVGPCACGAYTAPFLLPLYAHALSNMLNTPSGKETFIDFTSRNARKVFNLPPASRTYKLVKKPFEIPRSYDVGSWVVEPFWAGRTIDWSLE